MTSSRGLLLLLGWWESGLQQKKVASSKRNPEGSNSYNGHGPGAQWCNLSRGRRIKIQFHSTQRAPEWTLGTNCGSVPKRDALMNGMMIIPSIVPLWRRLGPDGVVFWCLGYDACLDVVAKKRERNRSVR